MRRTKMRVETLAPAYEQPSGLLFVKLHQSDVHGDDSQVWSVPTMLLFVKKDDAEFFAEGRELCVQFTSIEPIDST